MSPSGRKWLVRGFRAMSFVINKGSKISYEVPFSNENFTESYRKEKLAILV
jgi:hypothetical protein